MSSSGLRPGRFSNIECLYSMGVGRNEDTGTDGLVLTSGGNNKPMSWTSKTAGTNKQLIAGKDITMLDSGGGKPGFYDGSVDITISSTDTDTSYNAGDGIEFDTSTTPNLIKTHNDGVTIDNQGGVSGNENQVLKVPNDLTILNTSSGTKTFNGLAGVSIDLSDALEDLVAGDGIILTTDGTNVTTKTHIDDSTIKFDTGAPTRLMRVDKVANDLTINNSDGSTSAFNGSAPITINIPSQTSSSNTIHYNWWALGSASTPLTQRFQIAPTQFATGIVYGNLFFNGSSGEFVKMRYTMPAGSRYFKITLDFDYIWEQPLHKTTYSPFITYIRLIDDNTQADITLTDGATSQTLLAVCPPPPINFVIGDPIQHASISWIYDYGSVLTSDTTKTFRPQIANWLFDDPQPSDRLRNFIVMSKLTTMPGGSPLLAPQQNEFVGKIEDLGALYIPNTNKPDNSSLF